MAASKRRLWEILPAYAPTPTARLLLLGLFTSPLSLPFPATAVGSVSELRRLTALPDPQPRLLPGLRFDADGLFWWHPQLSDALLQGSLPIRTVLRTWRLIPPCDLRREFHSWVLARAISLPPVDRDVLLQGLI